MIQVVAIARRELSPDIAGCYSEVGGDTIWERTCWVKSVAIDLVAIRCTLNV